MAAFVRYSNTPRLANDDAVLNGLTFNGFSTSSTLLGPIEKIRQYEGGIKFASANIGVSLTAFFMQQRNLAQTGFVFVNGLPTQQTVSLGSDAPGLEFETVWTPIHGLSVNLRGVIQRPRVVTSVSVLNTDGTYIPLDGKQDDRVPNAYGSLNVGYTFPTTAWGRFQIDATASYTGKRYQDDANTVTLPAFQEYAAGASLTTKNAFVIRVQAANLFNGTGLTEGDPRGGIVSQGGTGVYFNARPLLPRSIIGSVTYKF
jgi:outer membrane cobalamin receptor